MPPIILLLDRSDAAAMAKLLGFAGVAQALSATTLKRDALALKENLRSDVLPVKGRAVLLFAAVRISCASTRLSPQLADHEQRPP